MPCPVIGTNQGDVPITTPSPLESPGSHPGWCLPGCAWLSVPGNLWEAAVLGSHALLCPGAMPGATCVHSSSLCEALTHQAELGSVHSFAEIGFLCHQIHPHTMCAQWLSVHSAVTLV